MVFLLAGIHLDLVLGRVLSGLTAWVGLAQRQNRWAHDAGHWAVRAEHRIRPALALGLEVCGRRDPVFSVPAELVIQCPGEFQLSVPAVVCRGLDLLSGNLGSGQVLCVTCL